MTQKAPQRFIKFIPSEEALYLAEHYPNATLLLMGIAIRARRIAGKPDGLEIGECQIGDYKKLGIASEKQYRTAKLILSQRGHIKIIETCRNRKKSATGGATGKTTVGTKVKLLRSDVWDINVEVDDHQKGDRKGDRGATEGRPKGDEQECKEVKEIKEQQQALVALPGLAAAFSEKKILLEPFGFDKPDFDWLMLQDLDAIRGAIAWLNDPATKIRTTKVQALKWKVKHPESKKPVVDRVEENRKFALHLLKTARCPIGVCFEVLHKAAEVYFQVGCKPPTVVKFEENGFQDQLQSALRKYGITFQNGIEIALH